MKHLEQVSKWEPGKKERERRERAEALLAKQASILFMFALILDIILEMIKLWYYKRLNNCYSREQRKH